MLEEEIHRREECAPPMQFPESQFDEGAPLTQHGVPATKFEEVFQVDVAVVEGVPMVDNQGHMLDVPISHKELKPRRLYERILKNKLKNLVFDKDGGDSTNDHTMDL
ncbi:hypothetical protein L1887_13715 [Cichorium endivia]|nr:hypothetical protein L1887_13715 [Cichorium endivia]